MPEQRGAGRFSGRYVVRHQFWRRLETEGVAIGPGADIAASLARNRMIARKAG
jgi:hypothetical protein